ncbi:hypothetical protein VPH166E361_0019 [Vibrio phage 166E36-1]
MDGVFVFEYLIIALSMGILGGRKSKIMGAYLVLSYFASRVVIHLVNPLGLQETLYTVYLIQPFVYVIFFTACYYHCVSLEQKFCVILCSIGFYLAGMLHVFYVPYYTELAMGYSNNFKIELIHNLCLTMIISYKKETYDDKDLKGIIKLFVFVYIWIVLKIWNWG